MNTKTARALPAVATQVLDVPAHRLASVIGGWPQPAILASGASFGAAGRYTILAAFPRLVLEGTDQSWRIVTDSGKSQQGVGDPLAALARLAERFDLGGTSEPDEGSAGPDDVPFQGGLIGFLGYDLAPRLERLPRRHPRDSRLPDLRFGLHDTAVIVDHRTGEAVLHSWDLTGEGADATRRRARSWRRAIHDALAAPPRVPRSRLGPLVGSIDPPAYLECIRRALAYIAAGDIFQVNLSQRFTARGTVAPLDLFLRLQSASPAPYSTFLGWDDFAVISASPELFYRTRGRSVITRPIKGTRPRDRDPDTDRRLASELASAAKDRAELTMIVDLERNDLGRVCEYGTVQVIDPLAVESFAQVHHLVATVEGRLRAAVRPVDLIRAVFPGGSITGAPKIRAMEIIDELEPLRRSLYTGAIGYLSRGSSSEFNIAIRTLLVDGPAVSYQVGGGIVADSDPQSELEETLHKGRGLRAVIEEGDAWA